MTDRVLVEGSPRAVDDALRLVVHRGPEFITAARDARLRARHYKGIDVGVYVVAASRSRGIVGGVWAANRNLAPGDNPSKICAETRGLIKIRRRDLDHVVALFVSGPPQPDTQSGIVTPTLHCCGQCRGYMAAAPEVEANTLLISVHPDLDLYEINMPPELEAIHRGDRQAASYSDPGFQEWEAGAVQYDQYIAQPDQPTYSSWDAARLAITGQLPSLVGAAA